MLFPTQTILSIHQLNVCIYIWNYIAYYNLFNVTAPPHRITYNSLTKYFRSDRYWAKSVHVNGPNLMLKFVQESVGHPV